MHINDAVAFVTGGTSGLGAGAVRAVVESGGEVGIVDWAGSAGEELAKELGVRATFVPTDVTKTDQIAAAIRHVIDRFERLNLDVNCAGIGPGEGHPFGRQLLIPRDLAEFGIRVVTVSPV